jgi:hypothetical protein
MLGVVKVRGGRKAVWINLFGDAQFVWGSDDREKTLLRMAVYRRDEDGNMSAIRDDSRRCWKCRHWREHGPDEFLCSRRKLRTKPLDRCTLWEEMRKNQMNGMNPPETETRP